MTRSTVATNTRRPRVDTYVSFHRQVGCCTIFALRKLGFYLVCHSGALYTLVLSGCCAAGDWRRAIVISELSYLIFSLALIRGVERVDGAPFVAAQRGEAARWLVHLSVAGIFLVVTARPLLALELLALGAGALSIANAAKVRLLGEALAFSDLLLLPQILRHPKLYYLHRSVLPLIAAGAVLGGLVALHLAWEQPVPRIVPGGVMVISLIALFAMAPRAARHSPFLLDPESGWGVARLGASTALVLQLAGWLQQKPVAPARRLPDLSRKVDLVVIQLESFVDLPSRGMRVPSLDGWSRLQRRSLAWGRLVVAARGANTTRTEFSVITGLGNAQLGFDRFQPYVRAGAYTGSSWFEALRRAGWATAFVHPFDGTFFGRASALPRLGAETLVWGEAFTGAPRVGRYVSDHSVMRHIVDLLDAVERPTCIMAVTMENHGPWDVATGNEADPVSSYIAHLQNGIEAVEMLIGELNKRERDTLVLVYGDHTPSLSQLGHVVAAGSTDYILIDPKYTPERVIERTDQRPEHLMETAIQHLDLRYRHLSSPARELKQS